MLDRNRVTSYLRDLQAWTLPNAVERELRLPSTRKIISIFGPRRSGKSYYLFQLVREALRSGARREDLLYLNFEDTRLSGLEFQDIEDVLKLHQELHPSASRSKMRVFLDEPQGVPGWERAVRSLHDKGGPRLYVTGSSAKLLSREIATALRGRTLPYLLLPYSFREFLVARSIDSGGPHPSTTEEARTKAALSEYLRSGGFPEVVGETDDGVRMRTLADYHRLIIYRDIVERYGIENLAFIKFLLGQLFSGFAREMSANKIYNTAKSRGFAVSKKTAYEYIGYVEDALAIFLLRRWAASPRTRETSLPKVYIADNGYGRLFPTGSEDLGRLAENAVYLELRRMQDADPLLEVYYWRDAPGRAEVDFALRKGGKFIQLMQVCHTLGEQRTVDREQRALLAAGRDLGCDALAVLNWDVDETREAGDRTIEYEPLWRWLQFAGA